MLTLCAPKCSLRYLLGKLSYLSLPFLGTLHSDGYIFPFLLCLLLLFFSQVFLSPPQTIILTFLHFFFLGMVLITTSCTMLWKVKVSQSRPTLWLHGLYWLWNSPGQNTEVGSLSLLQGMFWPRNITRVTCITGRFFTNWTIRKAPDNITNSVHSFSGILLIRSNTLNLFFSSTVQS